MGVLIIASTAMLAETNAQLTWDPLLSGTGSDGAGTWNTTSSVWSNGTSDLTWTNGSSASAVFGTSGTAGSVVLSGSISANSLIFNPTAAGTYTLSGATLFLGGTTPGITTNSDATITAGISTGGLSLLKSGTGNLTLNDTTTALPVINVAAGTLSTSNGGATAFGNSSTAIVVAANAKVQTSGVITVSNPFTFNGGSGDAAVIGGATLTGPVTLNSGTTSFNTFTAATISGPISGSGGLAKTGSQKLTLTGSNSYSGTTVINGGSVQVGNGGTTGSLGTGNVVNNQVLTFARSDNYTVPNSISGAGSVVKSGSGTMILTGSSSYVGTTTVSAGTLEVDTVLTGSGGSSGSVMVIANGATLVGNGSILGASAGAITLLGGGHLAPGAAGTIGVLSATSFAWTSDSTTPGMLFDLSSTGTSSDLLALSGAFSRTSGTSYIFDFDNSGVGGASYTLMTFASTSSATATNFVGTDLPAGDSAVFSFNSSRTALILTVIPEPSTVSLCIVALVVALCVGYVRGRFKLPMLKPRHLKAALHGSVLLAIFMLIGGQAGADTVTFNLETATLDDVRQALDSGSLTSVELVTMYLNRRSVYDQNGLKLNAFVQIATNAFADAEAADQRRANGQSLGPLDGIPFITKDSYVCNGTSTTGGIGAWKDIRPTTDNFAVAQLRAAGAVFIGHGNMDTFANSATNTVSDAYGATLNAYTLGVPAGSSGGPAVSTGADFTFFAMGGETGGSIRNPSDRAGIVGFKVGVGTVSVDGVLPLVPDRDVIGPMARYSKDSATVMDVVTTVNPNDEWSVVDYTPGRPKPSGFVAKQATASLVGKKFGVINTYVGTPYPAPTPAGSTSNTTGNNAISPEIQSNFNRTVSELTAAGATVVPVYLPYNVDTAVPLSTSLGGTQPQRLLVTSPDATYFSAWSYWAFLTARGQDAVARLQEVPGGRVTTAQITAVQNQTFVTFTGSDATQHFQAQTLYMNMFESWMDSNGFDALIWPTHTTKTRTTANPPGRDLVNNLGLPLCTMPNGVIPSTGEPTTVAFCGRYRHEADILALAHAYESITNYRIPTPLAPPLDGESFTYTVPDPSVADASASVALALTPKEAAQAKAKAKREDKLPPVLSIAGTVGVRGKGIDKELVVRGVAADKDGIGVLRVYVNGRKIASVPERRWKATVPVATLAEWLDPGTTQLELLVLAKDKLGNTSATRRVVPLPAAATVN